jgi:hypothetical protein
MQRESYTRAPLSDFWGGDGLVGLADSSFAAEFVPTLGICREACCTRN